VQGLSTAVQKAKDILEEIFCDVWNDAGIKAAEARVDATMLDESRLPGREEHEPLWALTPGFFHP